MLPNQSIEFLPHTSSITIIKLKNLGINTYWDLINYFPFRYEPFQTISPIGSVRNGEIVTIIGKIIDSKYQLTRNGLKIQKFTIQDNTGIIEASWFNQPYLLTLLKKEQIVAIAGEIKQFGKKFQILPKEYELVAYDVSIHRMQSNLKHTGRLIPVYPEKRGLSSKTIREKIFFLIGQINNQNDIRLNYDRSEIVIPEILPKEIINNNNLIDETEAYKNIHFPNNFQLSVKARERLSFDELFLIQLASKIVKQEWEKETVGTPFKVDKYEKEIDAFISTLPFKLTDAQVKVIGEIKEDLKKKTPMNRFLQGEVGSGKTVVAAVACYIAFLNGFQSLIMAPTEILAEQHAQTLINLFGNSKKPNIVLITGSNKPTKNEISNADIIIGTHALIQKKQIFKKIGFVVIDEQHRFGVAQRAELKNKGLNPHLLTMTATPIPRTVMLTLYGELDISLIDELPKNRLPIKTYVVPKEKREAGYTWINDQIKTHKVQAFIICPFIEESETETLKSVKAAKAEFEKLKIIFPKLKLGLLHGKCSSKEKQLIMEQFSNKQFDILVTTPVVEVGIDVPNATIMIIEGGERFGLAQLHQLRGRVGRGNKQSYCFVYSSETIREQNERLQYFSKTNNGNDLAEKDLTIRGPGNLFGTQQHGYMDLKIALLSDFALIEKTKKAVGKFIKENQLKDYPELQNRVNEYQVRQIAKD